MHILSGKDKSYLKVVFFFLKKFWMEEMRLVEKICMHYNAPILISVNSDKCIINPCDHCHTRDKEHLHHRYSFLLLWVLRFHT